MFDRPEAQFAISAVREAAQLVRRVQAEMVTDALTKGDRSPVTVGDFAAQALVAYRMKEALPGAVLLGEENAASLRTADGAETLAAVTKFVASALPGIDSEAVCDLIDRGAADATADYWTLDPIDGTKGFLRGDQYAVALGLVEGGRVAIGVLGCPDLADGVTGQKGGPGSILAASRGRGAHLQALDQPDSPWRRLSVSTVADPAQTRVLRSVEKAHTSISGIDRVLDAMGVSGQAIPMDSQAKYAVLAAGGGEMLVRLLAADRPDYREKVWDQAAGSIVIEEAGGRVTDLAGRTLDFGQGRTLAHNRGVLATNGPLHDAALAAIAELGYGSK
ncbi:Inositol-1-monophosphatase [Pirellulimonas nuda]|uniref:3'(2'),5'-bisphosphate nucleotidase n=1 Tax=Pirellulimonas nuda TaxID=2528009 RepID=A0A518DHW4_9BACT|nr:3'(2'),5'-bisphosphate nucleotidase [Pirellulimonas nuda]QDU91071.1 Inositol-1-monophosphatase [Pirellulimonas nuda]